MENSSAYSLNKQDIIGAIHSLLVWYGPVILLLLDQAQVSTFNWKAISALALSTTYDLLMRYVRGIPNAPTNGN